MLLIILLIISIPGYVVAIKRLQNIIRQKIDNRFSAYLVVEVYTLILLPFAYLVFFDIGRKNDCCSETAVFSPEHRLSVYLLTIICLVCYFHSRFRKTIMPPLLEVIINCFLLIGFLVSLMIAYHSEERWISFPICLSISLLFLAALLKNHNQFLKEYGLQINQNRARWENILSKLLGLQLFIKLPLLLLLCLPLLVVLASILLLFGQKPDSFIRAFTDTYKHGFSQLDHECANVVCEGHYLCTIAAKGHRGLVKPVRYGVRGGKRIICNRQLLISNAFEELIQRHLPLFHKHIRKVYDQIGSTVENYYFLFNYKLVSDAIFLLMKPLEWMFLCALYLFDRYPESRIATQYLAKEDRLKLQEMRTVR